MTSPLVAIITAALVFYVLIPGIGAFGVRRRWRRFRRRIVKASLLAPVTYASVRSMRGRGVTDDSSARFVGALESIQGEDTAWVRGKDLTIAVDMSRSDIYMLAGGDSRRSESPPVRTTWSRVGSLPEGVKVLVSGKLDTTGAHPVIRSDPGEPVLAVFYDGPEQSLVRRCTWSGRQLNEYWNSVTPGALTGGTFALIILAYVLLRQPLSLTYSRLAIGLAAVPILPLLPPGVALFYVYRIGWRRGRILRAHRDVLRLPLRYFSGEEQCVHLPTGELYCRGVSSFESVRDQVDHGLTVVSAPLGPPSARCTLFGRPDADGLTRPFDSLTEWTAVRGDPEADSTLCQHRARWYEIGSGVILAAGLIANFILVLVLLSAVI